MAKVEALFLPGKDVLDVKLAVDLLSGGAPSAVGNVQAEIESMSQQVVAMASTAQDDHAKLAILRRFIYEPGPWNNNRPFVYDLTDPLGTKLSNKRLETYLASRRGNCVSMPILFVILGQRIGLNLSLAQAPFHYFVMFTDKAGRRYNVETTSGGGFARDAWYQKQMPMNQSAIANGVYMRLLDEREVKVVLATLLLEYFLETHQPENAIITADILIKNAPYDAYVLVKKGTAYAHILQRDVNIPFAKTPVLRPEIEAYAQQLLRKNAQAFQAAENLGWRESDGQK